MDILFLITVILLLLCVVGLYFQSTNEICRSKKRLEGKTCLVTGGTRNIGLEVAIDFAMRGARVIVACPFHEEGESARLQIVQESGNDNVLFKHLNLASFDSVRKFAADFIKHEDRLDILMNNAGVGTVDMKPTVDGLNMIMQVNYFGAFLLTILLLPLLKKTGTTSEPSRIVNTSSIMHRTAYFKLNEIHNKEAGFFKRFILYSNSKLCLLLFSQELTKKLKGFNVVINDADPGVVRTRILFTAGYFVGILTYILACAITGKPFYGAQNLIHTAVDDKAGRVSGKYFWNCGMRTPSSAAREGITASQLWDKTVSCVGLSDEQLEQYIQ